MVVEKNNLESLLYHSLKDFMYNKETVYIFCNFDINNTDSILEEMLDTRVLDAKGIRVDFYDVDWTVIDNYYMFNTNDGTSVIDFIKDELIEKYKNKEFKIFIDIPYDGRDNNVIFDYLTFRFEDHKEDNIKVILQ